MNKENMEDPVGYAYDQTAYIITKNPMRRDPKTGRLVKTGHDAPEDAE
jgi:hypothetical protein